MQTVKVKAEARLDLLRQAGVAVETWLKSAMNQVMEELENERWNNLGTHDASLSVRTAAHDLHDPYGLINEPNHRAAGSLFRGRRTWSERTRRSRRSAGR